MSETARPENERQQKTDSEPQSHPSPDVHDSKAISAAETKNTADFDWDTPLTEDAVDEIADNLGLHFALVPNELGTV